MSAAATVQEPRARVRLAPALAEATLAGLRPGAFALAGVFALLALTHPLLQPAGVRGPMTVVALATSVAFLVAGVALRRGAVPARRANAVGAALAALALANVLVHLALKQEPRETTLLAPLLVAAGFILLDWRWHSAVVASTLAAWGAVAARAPGSGEWVYFGLALGVAAGLSHLVLALRVRAQAGLERERLRAEEREAQLRRVVNGAPIALFALDADRRFTLCQGSALAAVGMTSEDVVGRTVSELFHDAPTGPANLDRVFSGESFTSVDPFGPFWFETRWDPVRDADGRVVGAIGVATNVTEREAARSRLEDLGRLHAEIVDNVPAGVLYLDEKGTIMHENKYLLASLGARPGEAPKGWGASIFDLDNVRAEPELVKHVEGVLAGHAFGEIEITHASLYGRTAVFRVSGVPIRRPEPGGGERLAGAVLLMRDVTEEKRADEDRRRAADRLKEFERLKEMDRFKTQFINTAAHELGTPLTPIRIQLHLLKAAGGRLADEEARAVSILDRNFERLSHLVSDVLDVARLQSDRLAVALADVSLRSVVADAVESFAAAARERRLALTLDAPEDARVSGDAARLSQVMFNVLSNALKFTPDGGAVRVTVRRAGGEVVVAVRDSGVGLTPDQAARLFRPFSQAHDTMQRTRAGTGLGLFISKGLVEQHGGRMWVESDGPGLGSTFSFALPLKAA